MKLWTIQSIEFYEKLKMDGRISIPLDSEFIHEDFRQAYDWIRKKMSITNYPIWAWCKFEGKIGPMDMRCSGYAKRGTDLVQIELNVNENDVLLSDFELFHYVLNYWYLPDNEEDDDKFIDKYESNGFTIHDIQNLGIETEFLNLIRKEIEESWDKVLDINKNSSTSVQACVKELSISQVSSITRFRAK